MAFIQFSINGALSGALGGELMRRSILSATPADYASATLAANAFATQVGQYIIAANVSKQNDRELLIAHIASGLMARRCDINTTPGFYDAMAQMVNAVYAQAVGLLQ